MHLSPSGRSGNYLEEILLFHRTHGVEGVWSKQMEDPRSMSSGEMKKLTFSRRVVHLTAMHEGILYEAQYALRKLRTNDPEIKKVRDKFQGDIRDALKNVY